jgi:hypothetical protein
VVRRLRPETLELASLAPFGAVKRLVAARL